MNFPQSLEDHHSAMGESGTLVLALALSAQNRHQEEHTHHLGHTKNNNVRALRQGDLCETGNHGRLVLGVKHQTSFLSQK
jgi:hypothetical protein